MYSYDWDPSTGGYILNSTPLKFSKEPRPVYYKELDTNLHKILPYQSC